MLGTLLLGEVPPGEGAAPLSAAAQRSRSSPDGMGPGRVGAARCRRRGGVAATARLLLSFPAPNWFELAASAPGLFALALFGAWVATDDGARAQKPGVWLGLIAAAFGPALISGIIDRKAGLRFQIHVVAPLLVLALLGARSLTQRVRITSRNALIASALLVGCAMRPDYSIRAVLRDHGPIDSPFAAIVAPDHRGAANFVLAHAADDEWIAAEDPLQQHLLIGRTELWLRSFEDAKGFVRRDATGGSPREVYTGSRLVTDIEALRELAAREGADRRLARPLG